MSTLKNLDFKTFRKLTDSTRDLYQKGFCCIIYTQYVLPNVIHIISGLAPKPFSLMTKVLILNW